MNARRKPLPVEKKEEVPPVVIRKGKEFVDLLVSTHYEGDLQCPTLFSDLSRGMIDGHISQRW